MAHCWRCSDHEKKVKTLERDRDQLVKKKECQHTKIGDRLNLDHRIVAALFESALDSEHETIHIAIKNLLIQTKLIHPELAGETAQLIKELEAARIEQEANAKAYRDRLNQEIQDWAKLNSSVEAKNAAILQANLETVSIAVKALHQKLAPGMPYDSLTVRDQQLINVIGKDARIVREGFLMMRVRWAGPIPDLSEKSKIYRYFETSGWLTPLEDLPASPGSKYYDDYFDIFDNFGIR
jgi:hypothetical protein